MNQEKIQFYQSLNDQLAALLDGERNSITNLSQFSAFLNMHLDDINWVGFYLAQKDQTLKLGPFQGKVACTNIPFAKGVCGTAAAEMKTQVVEDVEKFAGHIACDVASRSEIVCPVIINGQLFAVLDIDSPSLSRFDFDDAKGLELLIKTLIAASDFKVLN